MTDGSATTPTQLEALLQQARLQDATGRTCLLAALSADLRGQLEVLLQAPPVNAADTPEARPAAPAADPVAADPLPGPPGVTGAAAAEAAEEGYAAAGSRGADLDCGAMAEFLAELSASWSTEATVSMSPARAAEPGTPPTDPLGGLAPPPPAGPRPASLKPLTAAPTCPPDSVTASRIRAAPGGSLDRIGRFQISGEIARGGMGIILKGWDPQIRRQVALKVLLESHLGNAVLIRRFLREARINGRLEHPGIVPVHEIGQVEGGRPYFAMRLVDGLTLTQLLNSRENHRTDLPRMIQIFEKICQAMAYAHAQRVIHRDLKPGNIMIGAFGVVKVMDWGLAKVLGEVECCEQADVAADLDATGNAPPLVILDSSFSVLETQHGTVFGTIAYLPPEQARGDLEHIDERADVFSLGGILCEILTGLPPYTGTSVSRVYWKASEARLEEACERLDHCGAEKPLTDLARRCLSPRQEDRPPHAGAVAEAVTAYLESDLRRAERDLVRFFDLSLDLFCIAGLDGYFHRVNLNFPRVLGHTEQELISRPFVDFVHPQDQAATVAAIQQLQRGLPVVRFRNRYQHADGHFVCLEWTAKSMPEEDVIYAVARDVTSQSGTCGKPD